MGKLENLFTIFTLTQILRDTHRLTSRIYTEYMLRSLSIIQHHLRGIWSAPNSVCSMSVIQTHNQGNKELSSCPSRTWSRWCGPHRVSSQSGITWWNWSNRDSLNPQNCGNFSKMLQTIFAKYLEKLNRGDLVLFYMPNVVTLNIDLIIISALCMKVSKSFAQYCTWLIYYHYYLLIFFLQNCQFSTNTVGACSSVVHQSPFHQ